MSLDYASREPQLLINSQSNFNEIYTAAFAYYHVIVESLNIINNFSTILIYLESLVVLIALKGNIYTTKYHFQY